MPLIAPEPIRFPDGLFSDADALAGRPGRWWVAHTKSRAEKSLARHLHGRSVPYFLPLHRRTWRNQGRQFNSYLPLFPGYVFFFGDEDGRVAALESNTVSTLLPVPDSAALVADLRRVDRLLAAQAPVSPVTELAIGRPVRIIAGPFEGLTGTLERHGGQFRLVVRVAFINQAVWAEVERWMVEPADQPALVGCS
jgi:transcription antitermination factor NusG